MRIGGEDGWGKGLELVWSLWPFSFDHENGEMLPLLGMKDDEGLLQAEMNILWIW